MHAMEYSLHSDIWETIAIIALIVVIAVVKTWLAMNVMSTKAPSPTISNQQDDDVGGYQYTPMNVEFLADRRIRG